MYLVLNVVKRCYEEKMLNLNNYCNDLRILSRSAMIILL